MWFILFIYLTGAPGDPVSEVLVGKVFSTKLECMRTSHQYPRSKHLKIKCIFVNMRNL